MHHSPAQGQKGDGEDAEEQVEGPGFLLRVFHFLAACAATSCREVPASRSDHWCRWTIVAPSGTDPSGPTI